MSEISITKIFPFLFLISCFSFITQAEVSAAPGDNNDLQDQQKKVAGKGAVPPVEVDSSGDLRRENPYRTEAEVEYPVHIHVFWESRYVTEGRDNLLGDGLLSLSTDISYGNFTFAPWFADSPDTDYRELNLNFVYGFKIGKAIEFYTAYSYLEFDTTDESGDDDEIGAGLVYTAFGSLDVITSWFYSFEAEGSYFELGAIHERPITDNFFLSLGITTGINDGYVFDGHKGFDHARFNIGLAYHPWTRVEISAYYSYSQAINRDVENYPGDINLDDFSWAGVGATYRF